MKHWIYQHGEDKKQTFAVIVNTHDARTDIASIEAKFFLNSDNEWKKVERLVQWRTAMNNLRPPRRGDPF